ncbi:MAG: HAMP domain-containing sensor histidine kinase [Ignavibacteriaceae bacterium]
MYFLVTQLRANFEDRSIVMLDTSLDVVRYALKYAMMSGKQDDLQTVINDISQKEGVYNIRIFDSEGMIKFASIPEEINKDINAIAPHHYDFREPESKLKVISLESCKKIYSNTEPLINEGLCQSCHKEDGIIAYLDIDTDLTSAETKFYTGSVHMIFLGWAVLLVLMVGLYFIFNRFINAPLQKLMLALNKVEGGDINVSLNVNRDDEIGTVYKHFNAMTYKLGSSKEEIEQLHLEELQRVNRLKTLGELTSETAHEVNNHIAIIMSRTDYLNLEFQKYPELLKYSEDLEVLLDQSSKISEINGNILKYSRKSKIEYEAVDVANVLNGFAKVYEPILLKKNIRLNTNINLDDATINGNSIQVNQILTNLVTNAADELIDNGEISISLSSSTENKVVLEVKDNGHGIGESLLEEIFSPFFTTKTKKNNTGLGLYIVKKICEQHKAVIVCESKINSGTSFIITFNKI